MSFKYTIPYILTSAAMLFGASHSMGSNEKSASDLILIGKIVATIKQLD